MIMNEIDAHYVYYTTSYTYSVFKLKDFFYVNEKSIVYSFDFKYQIN